MKSLKEKFGKFEMSKEEVKKISGGSYFQSIPTDEDDGDGSMYVCGRSAPSGTFETANFADYMAGLRWASEKDGQGWLNRGCW